MPEPSADQPGCAPHAVSFTELVTAYFDCRRHKRNTDSARRFEQRLEANLHQLHRELAEGTYRPGPSICFVITRPKPREVWAADFRDRIVHHLLYNRIAGIFHHRFIANSCACIPGRGTLYAVRRLEASVRSITQNWSRPAHYLKCDLANFFVSIDKRILWQRMAGHVQDPTSRQLAHLVLFHDPRQGAIHQSGPAQQALVPPHKRLGEQPSHLGLPIGNLSSQFFANIYLDALDQFAKHQLHAHHYVRYVDDFIILHESAQWLNQARQRIEAFLAETLAVRLNPAKTILQPVDRGIDFVGQVVKPWHRTLRPRTWRAALHRAAERAAAELTTTLNSYFGLARQASHSHRQRVELARLARRRGHAVDLFFTKAYP